ncbi:MAG: hypothetical protein QOE86_784 [Solirubrobacteraceae bacterium]|jgi:hypothetical protein|nr:hypothetical protein [Solirubrobacteraceae bacterium]
MRGFQGLRRSALCGFGLLAAALPFAGCGGGQRQDANEPSGNYKVEIVGASFPSKQSIADATKMKIRVRNADTKALPNVAVTIETKDKNDPSGAPQAFASDVQDPNLSDRSRPIWIVDQGPPGGETAYTNTWALGPLKPGATRTFEWKVTAVKPGDYTIDYAISPGLNGKAKLSGSHGAGRFKVSIDDTPPNAKVGDNGQVIRQPAPSSSSN